ncbi:MAG: hypothetical protein L0L95_06000 [Staphylococcus equorum]|nr:hypothetical protein [Staphylococcus equorum]
MLISWFWELLNTPIITEIVGGAILFCISARYAKAQAKKESIKAREEMNRRINKEAKKNLEIREKFYAESYEIELLGQIEIAVEELVSLITEIRFEYKKNESNEQDVQRKIDEFSKTIATPYTTMFNYLHLLEINRFDQSMPEIKILLDKISLLEKGKQFPEEEYVEVKYLLRDINSEVYTMQYEKVKEWRQL